MISYSFPHEIDGFWSWVSSSWSFIDRHSRRCRGFRVLGLEWDNGNCD